MCIKLPQGKWRNSGLRPAACLNISAPHQTKHHSGRIQGYQGTKGGPVKGSVNCRQGVAMVIMDRQEYTDKATGLLSDTNTYRTIPKDPTNNLKNKLIGIFKDINKQVDSRTQPNARYILPAQSPQSSIASPKYTKLAPPKAHSVQQGIHHIWGG